MNLVAKNGVLNFSGYGENLTETISFQVSSESTQKISIGESHFFGCSLLETDGKSEVSGRFVIEKITPANSKRHKLSEDKIGVVKFFDASSDEFGHYSYPAKIYFTVFVSENNFENIKKAILANIPVAHITCSIDDLDFSWEPDGSHRLWKLKDGETAVSHTSLVDIGISTFSIGFGTSFDDEYVYKPNSSNSKAENSLLTREDVEQFKKQQKLMQNYLAVIAVTMVFLSLKILL